MRKKPQPQRVSSWKPPHCAVPLASGVADKRKPQAGSSLVQVCIHVALTLVYLACGLVPVAWIGSVLLGTSALVPPSSSHRVTLGEELVVTRERVVVRDIRSETRARIREHFVRWEGSSEEALISVDEVNALSVGDSITIAWVEDEEQRRRPCLAPLPGVSATREMLVAAEHVLDWPSLLLWVVVSGIVIWRTQAQRGRVEKIVFGVLSIGLLGMAANLFWRSGAAAPGTGILLLAGLSHVGLACMALWNALTDRSVSVLIYPDFEAPRGEGPEPLPGQGKDPEERFKTSPAWTQTRSIKLFSVHVAVLLGAFLLGLFLAVCGAPFWLVVCFLVYVLASPLTSLLVAVVCLLDLLAGRKEAFIPLLLCAVYAVASLVFLVNEWPAWMGV